MTKKVLPYGIQCTIHHLIILGISRHLISHMEAAWASGERMGKMKDKWTSLVYK